jgi:hypothetical protein
LIGVAADLGISACLYQVLGTSGIVRKDTGFYLTAGEALEKFRGTLGATIPRLTTLTAGVPDGTHHLKKLNAACSNFPVIFTARAAAVHAGAGISHDVAVCAGKSVADFLLTLAESPKWKPYLRQVPKIPALPKEKTLIAQELAASLTSTEKSKVAGALAGIFLVLPELTKNEPAWLKTLQRVQVTPRNHDISVLVKTLQQATVGELYKVGKGAAAIATKIDPGNPNAIPIYIEGMKKKFDKPADAWGGYVGMANGQLEKGILSLPPIGAIYGFAAAGLDQIGLPDEEIQQGLAAHSLWPFISGALDYSGTKGPCFFLLRSLKVGEFGQLSALLTSASSESHKLKKALQAYLPLFEAIANNRAAPANSVLAQKLSAEVEKREDNREKLSQALADRAKWAGTKAKAAYELIATEIQRTDSLLAPLTLVHEQKIDFGADNLAALRLMMDGCTEREDIAALALILSKDGFEPILTHARKAIQQIDYAFFGPQLVG